jgi:hypothetical protein
MNKPANVRKVLRSGRRGGLRGRRPQARTFGTQAEMLQWVRSRCGRIQVRRSIPPSDMAMLFRLNETRLWAEEWVAENGLDPASMPAMLTIHASKGLEFPVVFLCDLEETVLPSYRRRRAARRSALQRAWGFVAPSGGSIPEDCDLEEEKRLFYVGVTRAERMLYLLHCRTKVSRGVTRRFERSRFLRLLGL